MREKTIQEQLDETILELKKLNAGGVDKYGRVVEPRKNAFTPQARASNIGGKPIVILGGNRGVKDMAEDLQIANVVNDSIGDSINAVVEPGDVPPAKGVQTSGNGLVRYPKVDTESKKAEHIFSPPGFRPYQDKMARAANKSEPVQKSIQEQLDDVLRELKKGNAPGAGLPPMGADPMLQEAAMEGEAPAEEMMEQEGGNGGDIVRELTEILGLTPEQVAKLEMLIEEMQGGEEQMPQEMPAEAPMEPPIKPQAGGIPLDESMMKARDVLPRKLRDYDPQKAAEIVDEMQHYLDRNGKDFSELPPESKEIVEELATVRNHDVRKKTGNPNFKKSLPRTNKYGSPMSDEEFASDEVSFTVQDDPLGQKVTTNLSNPEDVQTAQVVANSMPAIIPNSDKIKQAMPAEKYIGNYQEYFPDVEPGEEDTRAQAWNAVRLLNLFRDGKISEADMIYGMKMAYQRAGKEYPYTYADKKVQDDGAREEVEEGIENERERMNEEYPRGYRDNDMEDAFGPDYDPKTKKIRKSIAEQLEEVLAELKKSPTLVQGQPMQASAGAALAAQQAQINPEQAQGAGGVKGGYQVSPETKRLIGEALAAFKQKVETGTVKTIGEMSSGKAPKKEKAIYDATAMEAETPEAITTDVSMQEGDGEPYTEDEETNELESIVSRF